VKERAERKEKPKREKRENGACVIDTSYEEGWVLHYYTIYTSEAILVVQYSIFHLDSSGGALDSKPRSSFNFQVEGIVNFSIALTI